MRFNLNSIYMIKFLDHVEDGNEPIMCVCYGRLLATHPKYITVCAWDLPEAPENIAEHNRKTFTIVRSTIKEIKALDY